MKSSIKEATMSLYGVPHMSPSLKTVFIPKRNTYHLWRDLVVTHHINISPSLPHLARVNQPSAKKCSRNKI